jgi:hypothetical protein
VGDIRDILYGPRRWSLLLCFLHHAQVQTRDQLVEMVLKRVRHMTSAAKERLKELHEQHRELEEQMLAVFSEVLDHTIDTPEDEEATLGHSVRQLLQTRGGAATLRDQYEQVSAYHSDNYRPLMWGFYRPYRAELFRLSHLLTFHSATHDHSLLDALRFIQHFQHARGDYVPAAIALDFASVRWQALIKIRHKMTPMFHRRHLEVCVFHYLDHGLRSGDVYVEGSEAYADYRQQLLPWEACVPRLPAYCQALQFAPTATEFVAALRERLREVAQRVDAAYPANTALTIDEDGTPHLKRLPAQPVPDGLPTLEALLKARLPERHLLDILKNVHYWVGYTRHFGPLSGTERKLSSPVLRYIFTVFGYACELGASQTARHTTGPISRQILRRLNAQHITTAKLEAAVRDVVRRRLGTPHHTRLLPQPFRLVQVATGQTRKDGTPDVLVLVTNRLDLDAELLAVAYRYRWAVELLFRWVKCVLGCRHLLSQGINGGRIQVYAAFIASLLISLWVGRAPTKRTYEMLCFYLSGWAAETALIAYIDRLHLKAPPTCKN